MDTPLPIVLLGPYIDGAQAGACPLARALSLPADFIAQAPGIWGRPPLWVLHACTNKQHRARHAARAMLTHPLILPMLDADDPPAVWLHIRYGPAFRLGEFDDVCEIFRPRLTLVAAHPVFDASLHGEVRMTAIVAAPLAGDS